MKRSSVLALGVFLCSVAAYADRQAFADLGLSVWIPSGWEVTLQERTDTTVNYLLDDTTILSGTTRRHSGGIFLRAQSGVTKTDTSAVDWTLNEGETWSLYVQTAPLGGVLFLDDTMYQSGLLAREIYGQYLDSAGAGVTSVYVRTTGHGDVGWDLWAQSDTTDMDSAISTTYSALLDSIQLDTTFSTLPPNGIRVRQRTGPLSQALSAVGGSLRIRSTQVPTVETMDLLGRTVAGEISSGGDGIWYWRPRLARTTTLFSRVRADGETWTRRVVLDP